MHIDVRSMLDLLAFVKMRQNIDGEIVTFAYGSVVAANVDPIEKKTFISFSAGD